MSENKFDQKSTLATAVEGQCVCVCVCVFFQSHQFNKERCRIVTTRCGIGPSAHPYEFSWIKYKYRTNIRSSENAVYKHGFHKDEKHEVPVLFNRQQVEN